MKKKSKEILGEVTWTLIGIIARTPEALADAFLSQKSLSKHLTEDSEFLSDKLIHHLRNLGRRGYLEIEDIDGSTSVRLTTKGKIKNIENPNNLETDGQMRLVSYDIPEKLKSKRQQFCRFLRRIGFKQLQKSLWVCQYIKADEIDLVIDELEIRKFVGYFVIDRSNLDQHIAKLLK